MEYRRHKLVFLIASLFIMTFAGCGKEAGSESALLVTSEFCYRAVDNGCDTGKHCLATAAERCTALQNEPLNHGCAQYARKNTFFIPEGCPGVFTPKY